MELLKQAMTKSMDLVEGRIIGIGKDGKLQVKTDSGGARLTCDFLKTHADPLPELYLGTPVVCLTDGVKGYVIGVIQPYRLPEKRKQDPMELNLNAKDVIALTCGKSVLSMNKNGKIVITGTDITTHAQGPNKIKGTSVRLN